MIMGISYESLIAYLFIFMFAIIFMAVLASPIKWLLKLLFNSAIGAMAILLFNLLGRYINFSIGLNPGSILTVGALGIPGFILLLFLKFYLF
ncbi:sigmaK-factor processing regulatory protein BofA [Oxobacter pfennigii]|uniref:SigmaK-factor processing regulatory protein BofA n=1 Tax=Oxobacter pfennigii TaxID=36849 RepID=A0A0P8WAX6_9CLOT|nr:pro-sigmaK processing inhibitor BofA family protein [Oxobacter pfennigii]KPU45789.1 sigmaK-factor processing regulatory protein BofA [Oxobacter pfennigii]